jgi:aerobic C4-dicarboxylate transport protein
VVVGKWCKELDENQMRYHLDQETELEADEPEAVLDQKEEHIAVTDTRPLEGVKEPEPAKSAVR